MNKKCLSVILFLLMPILISCTLECKVKGLEQGTSLLQTNIPLDKIQNNNIDEQSIFKQGDKGQSVKVIQEELNKYGYNLVVDGEFGPATCSAVMDFQMRNKIIHDGIVGEETLKKLNLISTEETTYKAPESPDSTTEAQASVDEMVKFINEKDFSSVTDYFIWIDLGKQKVNIFSGTKGNWQLLKSMSCSSGKPSTPTVKGNFTVGIKGAYFIADGGARCKYYTQISGNYLFHSVLYDNAGNEVIDGTLGVPVSHGCIRLALENAKFIYDNIPAGTAIWSN